MGKIKNYDRNLYPTIEDAILHILDGHISYKFNTQEDFSRIYNIEALDDILFFLAENDIAHQYVRIPAPAGSEFDEAVSLFWDDGDGHTGHSIWYSVGKPHKRTFLVSVVVEAETEEDVWDWIDTVDYEGIKSSSWTVEVV